MESRLIVGVDGTESCLSALDWAVDEAARHGASLFLVHAWALARNVGQSPGGPVRRGPWQVRYDAALEQARKRAQHRRPGLDVRLHLSPEGPVAALVEESSGALAVVTGTRDRGELLSLLRGSVSHGVAAWSRCPVVVVRGLEANREGRAGLVTLGVGDSAHPQGRPGAVAFALREAEARRCPVRGLRAWRCPRHETVDHPRIADHEAQAHEERAWAELCAVLPAEAAQERGVEVHRVAREGRAANVLLQATAESDLLVVGIHRTHGHLGPRLSTVHHTLLHHADCPVAFVPNGG